jgi:hypothetical protein
MLYTRLLYLILPKTELMKEFKLLFILYLALTINNASAQLCAQDDIFTNVEYFSNMQIDSLKNVTYRNALNYKSKSKI